MNAPGTGISSAPVIDAQAIGKTFRSVSVLSDVTLNVSPGEIFGFLGPDGAGKTTLMQILAAILNPSSGRCRVLGFDTVREDAAVNGRVGYLSQGFTLYDRLSVAENLAFAARIRSVSNADLEERAKRLLDMAGLSKFRGRRAGQLSGGMRKKLSLCASLIHRPRLLLLDELSLGVDPLSRRELWDMLKTFRAEGVTIVITTPYMDEAEYCNRLGFMSEGRLVAVDTPAALRTVARGHTFELVAEDVNSAFATLTRDAKVLDVRRVGNKLRFQTGEAWDTPDDLQTSLAVPDPIVPCEPKLEDAFVLLSRGGVSREKSEPTIQGEQAAVRQHHEVVDGLAVELRNLTVKFGAFVAVDNVTLDVKRGELLGFLGPNGAGKTTLIRVLCGLLRPSAGDVQVAGLDVRLNRRRLAQRIGYMSQRFSLYPDMTSLENLHFFGGVYGLDWKAKRRAIERVARILSLNALLHRTVRDLSGAVRQRLALACSILHHPQVLFLDEPTSGVDPISRNQFWALIQQLADGGMTVFVTTHYLEEAQYADRLGLMAQGRLLAMGSIDELRGRITGDESMSMEEIFIRYVRRGIEERSSAPV